MSEDFRQPSARAKPPESWDVRVHEKGLTIFVNEKYWSIATNTFWNDPRDETWELSDPQGNLTHHDDMRDCLNAIHQEEHGEPIEIKTPERWLEE